MLLLSRDEHCKQARQAGGRRRGAAPRARRAWSNQLWSCARQPTGVSQGGKPRGREAGVRERRGRAEGVEATHRQLRRLCGEAWRQPHSQRKLGAFAAGGGHFKQRALGVEAAGARALAQQVGALAQRPRSEGVHSSAHAVRSRAKIEPERGRARSKRSWKKTNAFERPALR